MQSQNQSSNKIDPRVGYVWKEPRMPNPAFMGNHTVVPKPHYRMTIFCEKCDRRQKSEEAIKGNNVFSCKWCKHNNGFQPCSCVQCAPK